MPGILKTYRFDIYTRDGSEIEWSFGLSDMASPPSPSGPLIDPFEGKAEPQPWSVELIDAANSVTSKLADPATGRAWLLGRVGQLLRSVDGGAYQTLGTGRISYVGQNEPGLFTVSVEDEHQVIRNTVLWETADTTSLFPAGIRGVWGGFPAAGVGRVEVETEASAATTIYQRLKFRAAGPVPRSTIDSIIANPGQVRVLIDGDSAYPNGRNILAWGQGSNGVLGSGGNSGGSYATRELDSYDPGRDTFAPYISVSAGAGAVDALPLGPYQARIIVVDTPPSRENPLHVGMAGHAYGTATGVIHPFELVKRIFDTHSVRYHAATMAALVTDSTYPEMRWRVTKSERMDKWLAEHIWKPLLVAPFVNSAGEIAPRSIALPQMSTAEYNALPELNASNISRDGHPTWEQGSTEQFNQIIFRHVDLQRADDRVVKVDREVGPDLIREVEWEEVFNHE